MMGTIGPALAISTALAVCDDYNLDDLELIPKFPVHVLLVIFHHTALLFLEIHSVSLRISTLSGSKLSAQSRYVKLWDKLLQKYQQPLQV